MYARQFNLSATVFGLGLAMALGAVAADEPPKTWIDKDTGHRVVRLTTEPNSASLYFNQNGYTYDSKGLVYTTPNGISLLELATGKARSIVEGRVRLIDAGRKYPRVYYTKGPAVFVTDYEKNETRKIADLPARGSIATVNADETLLGGTYTERDVPAAASPAPPAAVAPPAPGANASAQGHPLDQPVNKGQMMENRLAARIPMAMYTISVQTGELKVLHRATDWLNHLLFSPTDPMLLMFCHEGPWHKIDRIWTIRTDGTALTRIHTRTMEMEIFGHEFWSADGDTIWYDLQTPRGEDFWLAGYNVKTGRRVQYHLHRNEWSIHFNVTRDGTLFCGDGGDPGQVAKAPDGEWIYLFRPKLMENRGVEDPKLIRSGVLRAEKLVNMSKHKYRLEPNVSFTPDQKWVVFRSNMFGATYVFAVEVEKAKS